MRMWVCSVRPSSQTISRCLPWLSTRSTTRPSGGCGPIGRGASNRTIGLPTSAVRSAAAVRWIVSPSGIAAERIPPRARSSAIPDHERANNLRATGSVGHMDGPRDGDHDERTVDPVDHDAPPIDLDPTAEELDHVLGDDGPRRRRSSFGTVLAAGMLGLEQALGKKPKEEAPIVIASNSDPEDIDAHGIVIDVDDERTVVAPPMPGRTPTAPARKRVKRRRDG